MPYKDSRKKVEMMIYVDRKLYESVRKLAFIRRQSMSQTMGQIIQDYIDYITSLKK